MNYLIGAAFVFLSLTASANVNCSGHALVVHAGIHGPIAAGNKYWVSMESGTYQIGLMTDEVAKARYAMLLTALTTGKTIVLKLYSHATCEQALLDGATPTGMYVDSAG